MEVLFLLNKISFKQAKVITKVKMFVSRAWIGSS